MDNHLFDTMFAFEIDMTIRTACARALLSSPNSQYRSDADWFLRNGSFPVRFMLSSLGFGNPWNN